MFAGYGITSSIIKGSKTMKSQLIYKEKKILLKDSYPVLSCTLSEFPAMKNIQKELFPYKYYTLERLEYNPIGIISEAGEFEDKVWIEEDYELFNKNIDLIPNCRVDEDHFDMLKYCSFYCTQYFKNWI